MELLRWILVSAAALLAGFLTVRYLTAVPLKMAAYAVLAMLCGLTLIGLIWQFYRDWLILPAALLALAGFCAGWLATNTAFLRQEEERKLPRLNPPPPELRDHTAVIYFTHGEPPGYDAMPWVETFKEIDAAKAPFIPVALRPFFFLRFRNEYLKLGGSPHNVLHQEMLNSLERILRAEGDSSTRFSIAFLDSNPRPDEAVIQAVNAGARQVIIANVFLTLSSHTEAGQDLVNALEIEQHYGIPVRYTEPLWDSPQLKQMFVDRAARSLGGNERGRVGVLLVGHGQPAEWDAIWPTQTSQEQQFREDVLDLLVADGFPRENLAQAWMEFKEPLPEAVAPALAARGVCRILVFAAAISASSLHSLYDIPQEVRAANLPPEVEVVNLGAWDNDPLVIRAIREKIRLVE